MTSIRVLTAAVTLASTAVLAQDPAPAAAPAPPPPPAEEIKRVLEYQDNGKDRGPALLDVVLCNKVDQTKGSATQFTCIEPLAGNLKKATSITAWVQFFCPKDGKYEDVKLKWLLGSETYETQDITISGLARTRTWRAYTPKKPGKWTVKVLRGDGDAAKELGAATFTVE